MQDFGTLRQPLLGELAMSRKKEEEEKKMPFIMATYVSACSQGQRTHSARTKNALYNGHLRFCLQPMATHALCSDQQLQGWYICTDGHFPTALIMLVIENP